MGVISSPTVDNGEKFMQIHVGQIYIEKNTHYGFNSNFQHKISEELTDLVKPSEFFIREYGEDFQLIFRMSAKRRFKRRPLHKQHYEQTEIWGPTVFRKDKNVEYTIFLPYYDKEDDSPDRLKNALTRLLDAIIYVLHDFLQMDTTALERQKDRIIADILADPNMVYGPDSDWAIMKALPYPVLK